MSSAPTKAKRKTHAVEAEDPVLNRFALFLKTSGFTGKADIRKLWTIGDCTRFRVNWWQAESLDWNAPQKLLRSEFFKVILNQEELEVYIAETAGYRKL